MKTSLKPADLNFDSRFSWGYKAVCSWTAKYQSSGDSLLYNTAVYIGVKYLYSYYYQAAERRHAFWLFVVPCACCTVGSVAVPLLWYGCCVLIYHIDQLVYKYTNTAVWCVYCCVVTFDFSLTVAITFHCLRLTLWHYRRDIVCS